MSDDAARYAIALTRLKGITQSTTLQALKRLESPQAAFDYLRDEASQPLNATTDFAAALAYADEELAFCREKNIDILPLTHPGYPQLLFDCSDAPLVLYYRGTAPLNHRHVVAVVGTRHITEAGKDLCQHFCSDLLRLLPDTLIVSGLAYGVDIHAHRACLAAGGETVAVLAHGLDRIYPALHRTTATQMISHGGLLTEYGRGTVPDKGNFVRRNRIVAGMAAATVVVESAAKGGALITAQLASGYSHEVTAFPGRPSDRYSEGCNALIRDKKARLITSAADLINIMEWTPSPTAPVQGELFPDLTPLQQAIVEKLETCEAENADRLAQQLNETVKKINVALVDLEIAGLVKSTTGGRYRLVR